MAAHTPIASQTSAPAQPGSHCVENTKLPILPTLPSLARVTGSISVDNRSISQGCRQSAPQRESLYAVSQRFNPWLLTSEDLPLLLFLLAFLAPPVPLSSPPSHSSSLLFLLLPFMVTGSSKGSRATHSQSRWLLLPAVWLELRITAH